MKQNKESQYEKQLNVKIKDRLSKMENKDYVFATLYQKGLFDCPYSGNFLPCTFSHWSISIDNAH